MYKITRADGALLGIVERPLYIKRHENGCITLADENTAEGVAYNSTPYNLAGGDAFADGDSVSVGGLSDARISMALEEAVAQAQASTAEPSATVGVLADGLPAWEAGKTYEKQYTLFTYDGKVGYTRQANLTALEVYPPFSTGTEALYGVRPVPDDNGVYPYVYNMAAKVGMRVRDEGVVYICIQAVDPLLYPPAQVPAHFEEAVE